MRISLVLVLILTLIYILPIILIKTPNITDCSNTNPYLKAVGKYSFKGKVRKINTSSVEFEVTNGYNIIRDNGEIGEKGIVYLSNSKYFPKFKDIFTRRTGEEYVIYADFSKTGEYIVTDCEKDTGTNHLNKYFLILLGKIPTNQGIF